MNLLCPICKSDKNERLSEDRPIFCCKNCGHEFTKLEEQKKSETYAPRYYLETHKNWFLNPNTELFDQIVGQIDKNTKAKDYSLLDIGCGKGDLLRHLRSRHSEARLYGVDLIENKNENIVYYIGDFYSIDFRIKFDFIVGLMVIEHIDNPAEFVKKIYECSQSQAIIMMVTINSHSFMYRLAKLLKKIKLTGAYERLYDSHHLQHYNNKSLRKLMQDNGFKVMIQKNHNFPLRALDLPEGNAIMKGIYYLGVAIIFFITDLLGGGMDQTIICRKM